MNYSYDEIYGVDLDTYCELHNTSIEQLISKIDIDIEILYRKMKTLIEVHFMEQDIAMLTHIYALIKKKTEHKERLRDWAAGIHTVG
jgi:hypothetical protein